MSIFGWAFGFFSLISLELLIGWRRGLRLYGWRDTELSLGLAFGWAISGMATAALTTAVIAFGYAHRLFDPGEGLIRLALLILVADLLYYLWHRFSHHLGWLWASHRVHHTAPRLNVLASVRQGWTDWLSGTWLTWAPLGFLGFSPQEAGVYFLLLLAWEAFIHNEWVGRLGPLEWLFVTPSHHRVHHSLERSHWNRNYGGVLIVWDRLFGTFTAEGDERITRFGLQGVDAEALGPVQTALGGWRDLFRRRTA